MVENGIDAEPGKGSGHLVTKADESLPRWETGGYNNVAKNPGMGSKSRTRVCGTQ